MLKGAIIRPLACTITVLAALVAGACGSSPTSAPAPLPTTTMKIGNRTFTLEIARDHDAQEHGLMDRGSMAADHGMIFIFEEEAMRHFWMKDTRFPLDILFLNAIGRVVSVHHMQPFDEQITSSDEPAQYAIELNQGAAQDSGVRIGDFLSVPSASTQPAK